MFAWLKKMWPFGKSKAEVTEPEVEDQAPVDYSEKGLHDDLSVPNPCLEYDFEEHNNKSHRKPGPAAKKNWRQAPAPAPVVMPMVIDHHHHHFHDDSSELMLAAAAASTAFEISAIDDNGNPVQAQQVDTKFDSTLDDSRLGSDLSDDGIKSVLDDAPSSESFTHTSSSSDDHSWSSPSYEPSPSYESHSSYESSSSSSSDYSSSSSSYDSGSSSSGGSDW